MKLCIGMMHQYDDHWLELHVPVLAESELPFVFLNGNGHETLIDGFLKDYGEVFYRYFDWNFARQQNCLNECAERAGYDAIIKLDPDELMYPDHLRKIALEIGKDYKAACLPRHNFVGDRLHTHTGDGWWPDLQTRVWLLNSGVEWHGQHHATAAGSIRGLGWELRLLDCPIYHYKWIADPHLCTLSNLNYKRTRAGRPPLVELPDDMPPADVPAGAPFEEAQPLDPGVIGARAPFGD